MRNNKHANIFCIIVFLLLPLSTQAQHYVGVRESINISGVNFNPVQNDTTTIHWLNVGVVYKYYNYKWVGFQAGLNYSEKGFIVDDTTRTYRVLELPLTSQFHYELWRLRPLINFGLYASYALNAEQRIRQSNGSKETSVYAFTDRDRRFEYGIHGGIGLGFMFDPFELQVEAGYQYAFSYMLKPQVPGERTVFSHFYHMILSAALLVRL